MTLYRTFKRTCTSWSSFANARKITYDRGLTYEEAKQQCEAWNKDRTPSQIRRGTMLEFTQE